MLEFFGVAIEMQQWVPLHCRTTKYSILLLTMQSDKYYERRLLIDYQG
jgi:hypothetical protein